MKLTKKGYIRKRYNGVMRMEHDVVWEEANGKIPDGYDVHHIDFDKTNNIISNLKLVTRKEHKKIHSGWKLVDGVWLKPCNVCKEFKTEDCYYKKRPYDWFDSECKKCRIARSTEDKKIRRAKKYADRINSNSEV